jgi:hypothetical protein
LIYFAAFDRRLVSQGYVVGAGIAIPRLHLTNSL